MKKPLKYLKFQVFNTRKITVRLSAPKRRDNNERNDNRERKPRPEGGYNKTGDRKPYNPDNKHKGEYKGSYNRKGFFFFFLNEFL